MPQNPGKSTEIDIFDIPVQVEEPLEPQLEVLRSKLFAAQRRLRNFARQYSWQEHVRAPFAASVRFYAGKENFDRELLQVCGLEPTMELPKTYCAALEQNILMSVSPELYRTLYPEGDEEDAFEKLLTHEMAHRLHIRILGGNEDAMGPIWFYEGFALYVADQFKKTASILEPGEIWAVVNSEERQDYRRYVTVFRHFLTKATLPHLVNRAGQMGFENWLKQIETE